MNVKLCCLLNAIRGCKKCNWKICNECDELPKNKWKNVMDLHDKESNHKITTWDLLCYDYDEEDFIPVYDE